MPSGGKWLTPEKTERLREMHARGMSHREIAIVMGVARTTVGQWLRGRRIYRPLRAPQTQQSFWTEYPEIAARVERLFDEGWAISAIGRMVGTTKNKISGRLWRLGLRRRAGVIVTQEDRIKRLEALFPPVGGCLYPNGDGHDALGWQFCGHSQRIVFDKYGEPMRSAYCEEHHALTHRKALKSENAAVLALKRDSTARVRWTRA